MKNILAILVILSIASTTLAATIPDFPFVFAQGEATINLPPDTAKMTFEIKSFKENSNDAVAEVQNRSVEVVNFLGKQGFGKETLVSYELNKRAIRESKDYQELKILGYQVTRRFELTIDDISKYETIAKVLFKTDGVIDIETRFGRKDQKKIEGELLASACANARRYAEDMAAGFKRQLGEVHCISKSSFDNIGAAFGLGEGSYGGGAEACMAIPDKDDFLFIPLTITFYNSVAVIFKLKDQ